MLSSEGIGLLFRLKAESDSTEVKKFREDVENETKRIKDAGESAFTDLAGSLGLSAENTAKLSAALPLAGTAIAGVAVSVTALAAGAIYATKQLYDMAVQTAQVGAEIDKFQKLTGLSVETINSLKTAAEQSGGSLEDIEEIWESFIEILIEGGQGIEDAKDKLISAGISPQQGFKDLDGSIKQAIKAISEAKTTSEQSAIAMKVFGESGLRILPIVKELGGNIDSYTEKLKEMGLAIDAEGIRKAKEFDRQTKTLNAQISGIGRTISMEFMPIFLNASKAISEFLKENKTDVKNWASEFTLQVSGLIEYWKELNQWIARYKLQAENPPSGSWSEYFKSLDEFILGKEGVKTLQNNPLGNPTWQTGKDMRGKIRDKAIQAKQNNPQIVENSSVFTENPNSLRNYEKEREDAEKAAKEQADIAKRNTASLIAIWRTYAGQIDKIFEDSYKKFEEKFKTDGNAESFRSELQRIVQIYVDERGKVDTLINNLEKIQAKELKRTVNERHQIDQQLKQEKQDWIDKYTKIQADAEKVITEGVKVETEKRAKLSEGEANRKIERIKSDADLAIAEREKDLANDIRLKEVNRKASNDYFDSMLIQTSELTDAEERLFEKRDTMLSSRFSMLEQILQRQLLTEVSYAEAVGKIKLTALEDEKKAIESIVLTDENRADIKQRLGILDNEIAKQILENEKATEEAKTKQIEREQKEVDLMLQKLEIQQKINDAKDNEALITAERPGYDANGNETTLAPEGIFSGWKAMWSEFVSQIEKDSVGVGNVVTGMAGLFINAFDGMAKSVGRAIENWALYGGSVGKALRQALAAELAHIAGVATVKALYATALGFMRLAELNFPAAGNAFLSAGMWAALAVGTGVAARAIAPKNDAVASNNFRQETSGAFGTASSGGSGSGYNSQNESATIIALGRNSAFQSQQQEVKIKYVGDNIFANLFEAEYYQNGKLRQVLRLASED